MQKRSLNALLDRHFVTCAAVAGAAAATGVAQDAEAGINYSGPQNIAVNTTNFFGLYLNFETGAVTNGVAGAADADINIFAFATSSGAGTPYVASYTKGGANNRVVGSTTYPSKLASGAPVGPAASFITSSIGTMLFGNPPVAGPQWTPPVTDGYLGVKFQIADASTHYGWMRINIGALSGNRYPTTIVDWAWETTNDTAIAAGAGVPEPSACALGMLALGSLGSRAWRKVRAA